MDTRNHIKEELKGISPWFAEISAMNPYEIPQGYFDGLSFAIMNRINSQSEANTLPLLNEQQKKSFEVPAGYFETLPDIILNRVRALESQPPRQELEALSPTLSKLDKVVPYSIPQGYFEDLSQDVIDGLKALEFVQQELETASPLFSDVKNKQVYRVPQDYFEMLPGEILNKVKKLSRREVKSVPLLRRAYRYAIAASFTGVIALAAWLFFKNDNPVVPGNSNLAGIEKVSDEEIIQYLDNNDTFIHENLSIASAEIRQDDVKALLSDVSDEELQQYLDKYSVSRDIINN